MNILITGGAGFIGSHVVRLFTSTYPQDHIYNLDALTYAGNLENLSDIEETSNYTFLKGDITDGPFLMNLFKKHQFDKVIHLAAESHVDRSIEDPLSFVQTNVIGTLNLLNAAKEIWKEDYSSKLFYHISTDEVYGSLGENGLFTETTSYDPNSPYAASKASSDHFVRAYDLADAILIIASKLEEDNSGVYHYSNKGSITWYEFAKAIFENSKIDVLITPVTSDLFPTKAKRPKNSVLDTHKIEKQFQVDIPNWKDSLHKMLNTL